MHGLKKLARDLWLSRGRTLTMVLAIAVGLIAFNSTLGAFGVLTREMERNYLGSVPASATLELNGVSEALLSATRQRPEVLAATRRKTIHARFRTESDSPWQRAMVFVIDDFETMPVAKIFHDRGAWPPPLNSVLVERSGLSFLKSDIGSSFWLRLPGQPARQVQTSGIAHEPALAPAQTEQAIYVYMTAQTAATFGVSPSFDELRVLLRNERDRDAIAGTVRSLASWIERDGFGVIRELRVPPPRHHPHQTQMTAVLVVVLIFTALVLLMSSFLAASLITTLMARQVREIGVMKAIGATKRQLAWMYTALVQVIAFAAILVAWLPGQLGARALTNSVARLLNFDIASHRAPSWVMVVQVGVGVSVPVLALLPAVWRASGMSVRRALDDHGVPDQIFGEGRLDRWVARARSLSVPTAYALRNVIRQRRQFVLSLGLLGAAGAAFVTAISVAQAWDVLTARLAHTRHYDLEARFTGPVALGSLARQAGALPGAGAVEVWKTFPTVVAEPGLWPIANTYPDDAHGAFHLVAPPDASDMLDVELEAGRWLRSDDTHAVVINQMVPQYHRLQLGDTLTLSVLGRPREFKLVGKTSQIGVGAVAYVSASTFDEVVPAGDQGGMLWVRRSSGSTTALQGELEHMLDEAGAPLASVLPLSVFKNALVAHFELLMKTLLALAALTAVVGGLSLGSAMSIAVITRTRELAVLRALGASRRQVGQSILLEGVFVGGLSLVGAALLGGTLAWIVGYTIGTLSFKTPLPSTFSWSSLALWGLGTLLLTLLASWWPAARAARLSVRAALNVL